MTGVVGVDVRVLVAFQLVGSADFQELGHHLDDLVDGFHRADVVARRDDRQVLHVGAEQVDLASAQILPIHPVPLGALKQWIVHVGDVLHVVHAVPARAQVAVDQVEGQIGGCVAQVGGVVGSNAADVHPHLPGGNLDGFHHVVRGVVQAKLRGFTRQLWNFRFGPRVHGFRF